MSRTTQYIGLNGYARKYVEAAIKVETYEMTTGMFDEPVMGHIYTMPVGKYGNTIIAKEAVFVAPWSSGMMIFTCLKLTLVRPNGDQEDFGSAFEWMLDPSIANEYDFETGRYYV